MKTLTILLTLSLTAISTGTMAYSLNGSTEDGFVLKCKDGTTFKSSVPPNHNTCMDKCGDHGGIAAGYPKKIFGAAKASPQKPAASAASPKPATSHNASRSNRSR